MGLISNIGLITAEALLGERNEKEPTFNKVILPDNDEVKTILIGDFCGFYNIMVYRSSLIEKRCKYMWRPDQTSKHYQPLRDRTKSCNEVSQFLAQRYSV